MKKTILFLFLFALTCKVNLFAKDSDTLCVGTYNLENLFDTVDDPQKDDEEFLPSGSNAWTQERLNQKLYNLSRVIKAMNDSRGPDILGVCEVEHQSLLDTLTRVYLNDKYYKVAYLESPDNRGIDNGLIYNADKFSLVSIKGDTVRLSDGYPTRLVLEVTLELRNSFGLADNKITFFENHWPSRRGGEEESEKNRVAAAETAKRAVDSLLKINPEARIVLMGDFNDEPANASIIGTLGAAPLECSEGEKINDKSPVLFNAAYNKFKDGEGSYKYRDDWNMLDQIIVSKVFLTDEHFKYLCDSFIVFKPDFAITKSGKYAGTSIPTYGGKTYLGGFSDHFPVNAKFIIK